MNKSNCQSPGVKTFSQSSEQAQPPIHIPIVLNGDCYVVTQQDVRIIEDKRSYSYFKMTPNGEFVPINIFGFDSNTIEAIQNACNYQIQMGPQMQLVNSQPVLADTPQNHQTQFRFDDQPCSNYQGISYTMPTDDLYRSPAATIEQQLKWNKSCINSSDPFPMTKMTSTSTTDLRRHISFNQKSCGIVKDCRSIFDTKKCPSKINFTLSQFTNGKEENISALQQLKAQKIKGDF